MKSWVKASHILIVFCLVFALACSKKNTEETEDTKPNKEIITLSKDLTTCQTFFAILSIIHETYLEKTSNDITPRLKFAVDQLEYFADVSFANKDKIKWEANNCEFVAELSKVIQASDKIKKRFGNDKGEFDTEGLIYQNLLHFYLQSYDRYSRFESLYTNWGLFEGESSQNSGLRLLIRPDYYTNYNLEKKDRPAPRKPKYLYVEYSPLYLQEKLPQKTRIYKINDFNVSEHEYQEALDLLDPLKSATLEIETWNAEENKYNDKETKEISFKKMHSREITFELLSENPNIGYIQFPTFMSNQLTADFYKSWSNFKDQHKDLELDGTIIDFRSNTGGISWEVGKFMDALFTDQQIVGVTAHRKDDEYVTDDTIIYDPNPLTLGRIVALTNFMSASATESTIAALKDYNAALVVGESTVGKGIGQVCEQLGYLHISGTLCYTDHYIFSPAGSSWYLEGIPPHIEIKEPANEKFYRKLKDVEKYIPKPYEGEIESHYNPDVELSVTRVTKPVIETLQAFHDQSPEEEKTCVKELEGDLEESSCIKAWGVKLLNKWIELDKGAPEQEQKDQPLVPAPGPEEENPKE